MFNPLSIIAETISFTHLVFTISLCLLGDIINERSVNILRVLDALRNNQNCT